MIATFVTFIAWTSGFDLNCTIHKGRLAFIPEVEYCWVESLEIRTPNETITSVNGQTTPTELQGLMMSFLPVDYLPKGIGTFFPKLIELLVEDCGLKSISAADLENLGELESIQMFNNSIEELSSDLFKFTPKLRHITFGLNKIYAVGKDLLTNFTSLESHYFDRNTCTFGFREANFSTVVADLMENCPEIEPAEVTCRDKGARCNIEYLLIDRRRTKLSMQSDREKIESLVIFNQKVVFLPFKLFVTLPNLKNIEVIASQLSALHEKDFEGLVKLEEIKIERNNISLIEEVFDDVPQLKHLHLADNNIELLPPKVFTKLTHLEVLKLGGNKLVKFLASFLPPKTAIREFHLQHNELQIIDSEIIRLLMRAELIDLTNNPCIDLLFHKMEKSCKSLRDIFNDVEFQCSDSFQKGF